MWNLSQELNFLWNLHINNPSSDHEIPPFRISQDSLRRGSQIHNFNDMFFPNILIPEELL